jgi:PAS domain S-box-containing protein
MVAPTSVAPEAARPPFTGGWLRMLPVMVLAVGLVVTIGSWLAARARLQSRLQRELAQDADNKIRILLERQSRYNEGLTSLANILGQLDTITPAHLSSLGGALERRQVGLSRLEWIPRVAASDRAAIEQWARGQGSVGFTIRDEPTPGDSAPAAERMEYFPVLLAEPPGPLGLDLAATPLRDVFGQILETGVEVIVLPVPQPDVPVVRSFDAIFPVFRSGSPTNTAEGRRRALRGFLRAEFDVPQLMGHAFAATPALGLDTLVTDVSSRGSHRLYYHASRLRTPQELAVPDSASLTGGMLIEREMSVANRLWRLQFRTAPQWFRDRNSHEPVLTLTSGLVVTGLLSLGAWRLRHRMNLVERVVERRTGELQLANQQLAFEAHRQTRLAGELARSQSSLLAAQRATHSGSWEADLLKDTLTWSSETYRIFGVDPATFRPGRASFFAMVLPEDHEKIRVGTDSALVNHTYYRIDYRIRRPDGGVRVLQQHAEVMRDDHDRPIRLVGAVQDVTEHHQAQQALLEERRLLRTLIDAIPDAIYAKNREGRFLLHNTANLRLLQLHNHEDAIGKTVFDIVPTEIARQYHADDQQVIETGESLLNREEPFELPDGTKGWFLTTKIPLHDETGRIVGLVGVSRDITDRKLVEAQRHALDRQLQDTARLESLGVLAGGIAHDFNNLLTGIIGHAGLALLEVPPTSTAGQSIQELQNSAERAADLCRQMLAYAGKGRLIVRRLDLNRLVRETTGLLQISVSKKAVLKIGGLDAVLPVEADATQLQQIVMNLVINASEAIGDQPGTIRVFTGRTHVDAETLHRAHGVADPVAGDYAFLDVTDDGCGMSEDVLRRIFEPFFTTKFTGRGLGLAATLGIVRGHHGALEVSSEEGRGSRFRLYLPLVAGDVEPPPVTNPSDTAWRGSGRILIIDDESSVREVTALQVQRLGFQATLAEDGRLGLDRYLETPQDFAIVLLDVTMPNLDGTQVLREIHRANPRQRVVLMSGYDQEELVGQHVGGPVRFLMKPFLLDQLRKELRASMETGT